MAKKYNSTEGVWRTIGGRRVFIKTGQSLSDAMRDSGKFKTTESGNVRREDVVKVKHELEARRLKQEERENLDNFSKNKYGLGENYWGENYRQAGKWRREEEDLVKNYYDNPVEYKESIADLKGKHIEKDRRIDELKDKTLEEEGRKVKREYNKKLRENDRISKGMTKEEYKEGKYNFEKKERVEEDWREQVKKNDAQLEKDLENYKKTHDISRESDGYYELFRENERRNAKIKKEIPEEPYEFIPAYAGYRDKSYKLAGTKMEGQDVVEYGRKSWTGKEYTNDEFMEHLEDSNWHSERKALLEAGLTNQELSYIKDRTTLSQWSVGEELTGSKNTQKMIDEAKAKFRINEDISPMSEWSDTTGTGFSDLQSSTLKNRYKGTYEYLQQTTNMTGAEILELLKKIEEDNK